MHATHTARCMQSAKSASNDATSPFCASIPRTSMGGKHTGLRATRGSRGAEQIDVAHALCRTPLIGLFTPCRRRCAASKNFNLRDHRPRKKAMDGTISSVYSTRSCCQWTCLAELADSKPPRAFAARRILQRDDRARAGSPGSGCPPAKHENNL